MDKGEVASIRYFIREAWSIGWPMVFIMSFEFLIGLADVYIAGRVGKEVQAAYGFVFQLYFLFIVIANSLAVGSVSVISKLFTSEKIERFNAAVFTSISSAAIAGIFFGALAVIFSPYIVILLNLPEAVKGFAQSLIGIYAFGIIFHYILINTNSILRACRMVRKSLRTMAVVCLVNIGLNFFFVFRTQLGFKGIALSTVISVLLGSILNLINVKRLIPAAKEFSINMAGRFIKIGWPIGLLQLAWQGGLAVLYLIVSSLPEYNVETLAAFTNGLRIESAIFLPAFAFNLSNAVVIGNQMGLGKKEGAFRGGIISGIFGVSIVIVMTTAIFLNARAIASLLSGNAIVVRECVRYLYIALLMEPFTAWGVILGGGLNGAGDTRGVMKVVVLSFWLIRIPLSYLFGILLGFGAPGIWWSMNASILIQAALISKRYFRRKWFRYAV